MTPKRFKHLITALALMATPAAAEPYLALNLGSHHINATRAFNEANIGVGAGIRWGDGIRAGLSGGVFLNSYSHWSTYVAADLDFRVIDTDGLDVYAGAFVSLVDYPNLVGYADKRGIPRVGSHIMIAGLEASLVPERGPEWLVRYVPVGDKMSGVASFSLRFPFGG